MKALIAAGGHGTRLRPVTWTVNKHLIPLANEPLLFNAIGKIVGAGITDIAINVNPGETEIQKVIGDGSRWDAKITYIEQQGGPCGIGQIVYNARDFIDGDDILFYLGDNIILGSLKGFVDKFKNEDLDCCLAFADVKDPTRFGVAEYDENGKIAGFIEKPAVPPSSHAVTGIYIYKMAPHLQAFANIEPSARGEYEITHINDWLLKNGYKVGYEVITGWWKDTGGPHDLLEGNQLLLNEMEVEDGSVDESSSISKEARVQGRVKIGSRCKIGEGVLIRGPVVIGDEVELSKCYIGPHTAIGNKVKVENAEIEHSIVMDDSTVTTSGRIVDSIIGRNVNVVDEKETRPSGKRMVVGENSYIET